MPRERDDRDNTRSRRMFPRAVYVYTLQQHPFRYVPALSQFPRVWLSSGAGRKNACLRQAFSVGARKRTARFRSAALKATRLISSYPTVVGAPQQPDALYRRRAQSSAVIYCAAMPPAAG